MKNQIITLFIAASICTQLCACQSNPSKPIVISKNDGSFDSQLTQSAPEGSKISEKIQYSDKFTSTDGSIEFSLNIKQILEADAIPVVEVVPHKLLPDDVKRVAGVLFEGATFYEREPTKDPSYSKDQLQKAIHRWSQYANSSAMATLLWDNSNEHIANKVDYLKGCIEQYTKKLDTAPVDNPHTPCDWTFKKDSHYNNLEAAMFGGAESDENDVIYTTVELGDIEYIFAATTHNEADYKLNTIDVSLSSGVGPAEIDLLIYRSMLCRTPSPTNDQILTVSSKAQDMLDKMELGNWTVTNTYVETTDCGGISEHIIVVEATPTFGSSTAIYGQKTPSSTAEDTYTTYYPVSRVLFGFSANGELIHFRLQSPVEVKEMVNSNVQTLSLDTLVETAKQNLVLSDAHSGYVVSADVIYMYEEVMQEELICKIEISTFEFGLARINVANSDNSYYYVPTIVFKGKADYFGKNTGNLYISSNDYRVGEMNLIWINAIDGSIMLQ